MLLGLGVKVFLNFEDSSKFNGELSDVKSMGRILWLPVNKEDKPAYCGKGSCPNVMF